LVVVAPGYEKRRDAKGKTMLIRGSAVGPALSRQKKAAVGKRIKKNNSEGKEKNQGGRSQTKLNKQQ